MKTKTNIINAVLALLAFACFTLLPKAQALLPSPTPDGGYPGANTAEGTGALFSLTSGGGNTAVGANALTSNTTGSRNTAIGDGALVNNNGSSNTVNGIGALTRNTTGSSNTASGDSALYYNNGSSNTANGNTALIQNTDGNSNTAIGDSALFNNTTGNFNVGLGANAGNSVTTANNVICIGHSVVGANVSNTCFIGNIFGKTSSGGVGVLINANGKLGTVPSSRRFKNAIEPMNNASEAILALKPVTFRYKKEIDPAGTSQFGLVAEDVEKVNPDLIVRDKEGKPYSVRYDQVNAMLLNEFLKEHRTVQQQGATIARQQKQIEALAAGLQKVSAQLATASPSAGGLEVSKPARRTVMNNR